jgi:hypothetical protein
VSVSDELDPRQAQILRAVRQAGNGWAEAMRAHKLAPPDPGFSARRRALAQAAATEQVAWEHANAAGLHWRPIPGAEGAEPPYELRPGTAGAGPRSCGCGLTHRSRRSTVPSLDPTPPPWPTLGELSDAAGQLADAVARGDEAAARSRGAA